jgi:hypothetical protein
VHPWPLSCNFLRTPHPGLRTRRAAPGAALPSPMAGRHEVPRAVLLRAQARAAWPEQLPRCLVPHPHRRYTEPRSMIFSPWHRFRPSSIILRRQLELRPRHLVLPARAAGTRRRHTPPPTARGRLRDQDGRRDRPRRGPHLAGHRRTRRPGDRQTDRWRHHRVPAGDPQVPDPAWLRTAVGAGRDPAVRPPTVGEWLGEGLGGRKKLRPGTVLSHPVAAAAEVCLTKWTSPRGFVGPGRR